HSSPPIVCAGFRVPQVLTDHEFCSSRLTAVITSIWVNARNPGSGAPSSSSSARNQSARHVCMPSDAAPAMSVASVSPTKSVADGSTPSASSARSKMAGCGLRQPTSDENTATSRRSATPICSRSRWSRCGGSSAFDTSPTLRPRARRLEQRVRRRREHARRLPSGVLGLEEALELAVGYVDPLVREQPADEARVLDLLERAGNPQERQIGVPEALRQCGNGVAADRAQSRVVAHGEELGLPLPPHERVAPVEENGL